MVKRNPARLVIWRTIKNSFSRYLAILAIIALGAGVFSGLRVSSDAMIRTGDTYYRSLCFSDFTVMSTLGFTDEELYTEARMLEALNRHREAREQPGLMLDCMYRELEEFSRGAEQSDDITMMYLVR